MNIYLNQIADQEVQARCCALFSRSHKSFKDQLETTTKEKSSEFAKTYVSGYGHNSINDCGNICAAIERVSMIAAKFIEDHPLFNGQESSTRYIPFDIGSFEDNVVCPFQDDRRTLQEDLMSFYKRAIPIQQAYVAQVNDLSNVDLQDKVISNAVKAKSFDVLRGFLPAGCKTQLAWSTTFRQACERLEMMCRHPLSEIREIGTTLQQKFVEMYPGASYGLLKENYTQVADEYYNDDYWDAYHVGLIDDRGIIQGNSVVAVDAQLDFNPAMKRHHSKKLPPVFDVFNDDIIISAKIDYGSWRDIHRHRNCKQIMPILEAIEFESFYVDNLAPTLRFDAKYVVRQAQDLQKKYSDDVYLNQYFVPMGFKVMYQAKWSLSQLVYVLELRSRPTVHHTARKFIKELKEAVDRNIEGISDLHVSEMDLDNPLKISIERGRQS